jgi:hypothetical protein
MAVTPCLIGFTVHFKVQHPVENCRVKTILQSQNNVFDFSSFNFILLGHMLSTVGAALHVFEFGNTKLYNMHLVAFDDSQTLHGGASHQSSTCCVCSKPSMMGATYMAQIETSFGASIAFHLNVLTVSYVDMGRCAQIRTAQVVEYLKASMNDDDS